MLIMNIIPSIVTGVIKTEKIYNNKKQEDNNKKNKFNKKDNLSKSKKNNITNTPNSIDSKIKIDDYL